MPRNKNPDLQDEAANTPVLADEEDIGDEEYLMDDDIDEDDGEDIERAMGQDEEPDALDGARRPGAGQVDH
jgi:hypothetical protein